MHVLGRSLRDGSLYFKRLCDTTTDCTNTEKGGSKSLTLFTCMSFLVGFFFFFFFCATPLLQNFSQVLINITHSVLLLTTTGTTHRSHQLVEYWSHSRENNFEEKRGEKKHPHMPSFCCYSGGNVTDTVNATLSLSFSLASKHS